MFSSVVPSLCGIDSLAFRLAPVYTPFAVQPSPRGAFFLRDGGLTDETCRRPSGMVVHAQSAVAAPRAAPIAPAPIAKAGFSTTRSLRRGPATPRGRFGGSVQQVGFDLALPLGFAVQPATEGQQRRICFTTGSIFEIPGLPLGRDDRER